MPAGMDYLFFVCGMSAIVFLAMGRWNVYRSLKQSSVLLVLFIAIIACGWLAIDRSSRGVDRYHRANFLHIAETAAASMDPDSFEALSDSPADLSTLPYRNLKAQLMRLMHKSLTTGIRWYYTMKLRGDEIIFSVDSIPLDDPDYEDPGSRYTDPPPELMRVFSTGRSLTTQPYVDRWGNWISAFVPLMSADGTRRIGVL